MNFYNIIGFSYILAYFFGDYILYNSTVSNFDRKSSKIIIKKNAFNDLSH